MRWWCGVRLVGLAFIVSQVLFLAACEPTASPSPSDSAGRGATEAALEHTSDGFCLGSGEARSGRFVVEGSLTVSTGEVRGARFASAGNVVSFGPVQR